MSPAPVNPKNPSGPSTEDQLRAALAGAAPTDTHVDRGLVDLADRLAGGATVAAPVALQARRVTPRRVLGVAAALLMVVGIAAVAATRGDQPSKVVTQQTDPSPTGWYIPKGLTDEWEVTAAAIDTLRTAGPGALPTQQLVWTDQDAPVMFDGDEPAASLTLSRQSVTASNVDDVFEGSDGSAPTRGIDLGHGITATSSPGTFLTGGRASSEATVAWQVNDTRWILYGRGLSERRVIDAARGVSDAEDLEDPPLDGFELVDRTDQISDGLRVRILLTNTRTGAVVGYTLGAVGSSVLDTSAVPAVLRLPGAPGPLLQTGQAEAGGGNGASVAYLGRWPGADVSSGPETAGAPDEQGPVTDADVQEALGSLRPATAAEWAAFLRGAPEPLDHLDDLSVASLADVVDNPIGRTTDTVPAGGTAPDVTTSSVEQPGTSVPVGLTAADLSFAPVLEVQPCSVDPGFEGFVADVGQEYCYRLGPVTAGGTDLHQAAAALQQEWVVNVRAQDESVDRLNVLFNACFDGSDTCPAQAEDGRGAIAVVLEGQVISAPAVNGRDLADDVFTISAAGMTEQQAKDLAAAINANSSGD